MFSSSSNLRRSFIGDSRTARAQHDNVMAALASRAGFEAGFDLLFGGIFAELLCSGLAQRSVDEADDDR